MADPPPQLPPRFLLQAHIGDGATGHVYHALDTELSADVALKVVRRSLAMHRRFRARFAREIALLAEVPHEHVVPVHDHGTLADGSPYVALAYANRGSLRDRLHGGIELPTLLELLEQVCLALAALHARGLIHQDLKPANVLLHSGEDGRLQAWVADLGVTDDLHELARDARRVGGTPTYMAPEQLRGKPQEFGPWTDLYAVGIMLYEALAGDRPHPARGRRALLEARLAPPPELVPARGIEIPPALSRLVGDLLDAEPRQRYDRAADVCRVLRRIRAALQRSDRVGDADRSAARTETQDTCPVAEATLRRSRRHGVGRGLRWNRVPPDPIPPDPPPQPGIGAAARASLALFALRELPLVARESARIQLWQAAREVVATASPRLVLVVGDAGSGKSRLVGDIARSLDEGGWMESLRLRYHDPPGHDDGYRGAVRNLLAPWNDSRLDLQGRLARWLSRDREKPLTEVLQDAGLLARWCGYLLPGERPANAALGLAFLHRHLEARAWRGGSCLVLEDIHAGGVHGEGLAIAEGLLATRTPVLVLATLSSEALARDEALRHRLEQMRAPQVLRVGLSPLDLSQTRALLSEALPLEPALAAELTRRLHGSPMQAAVLLREWARRGTLVPGPRMRYHLAEGATIDEVLPPDLHTLYLRRLESAVEASADPVDTGETLAAMALAGQEPPVAVLRRFSSTGLDELLASGLLRQEGGLLRFEHGELESVALRLARELDRAPELHRRLAEAWEALGKATGMDVGLALGSHRLRSGRPLEALPPLMRATRAMLEQGRPGAAVHAAELAITAADLASDDAAGLERRLEARRLRAQALLDLGQHAAAEQVLQEALALGKAGELGEAHLQATRGAAMLASGELEAASELLDRARRAFTSFQDTEGLAQVAWHRGSLFARQGRENARRRAWAERAWREVLDLTAPEHPLAIRARSALVRLHLQAGRPDRARPVLEDLRWAAHSSGDTRSIVRAGFAEGQVLLAERRPAEAMDAFSSAGELAAMTGERDVQLACAERTGETLRRLGRLDEATAVLERQVRLARGWELPAPEIAGRFRLALVHLEAGDSRRAATEVHRVAELLERHPRDPLFPLVALLHAALGTTEPAARHWWRLAREHGLHHPLPADATELLRRLHEAAATRGWESLAREAAAMSETSGA